MTKKRTSVQQASLFKPEIPKMPEGYYSSGPNPNLRRFVEEHSTPYDPETDDYNVPPFDQPITTARSTAIYNMHTYWSKKPPDAIRQYIRHYTQPGDMALDSLCGSGTTALAALMEGRPVIAIDLSPAATFITKNHCTPVDVDKLQCAFEELQARVEREMGWLYETRCDRCDGRATTVYTVYSQVFQCPRCLEKIPLFDCTETEGQTAKGKPKRIRTCPHCHERGHIEEIKSQSQKFGAVPVLARYECQEGCKPQRANRRHNDSDPKKRFFFEQYDFGKIREIESKEVPHWYPKGYDMTGFSRYKRDALRLYGIREVADLFTNRNLWALAALLDAIRGMPKDIYRDVLTFGFTSILLKASRMMAHNRDGIGRIQKGTYYIPQIEHDINVGRFMAQAVSDLKSGYRDIVVASPDLLVSTSDARDLDIQSETVDYIFTDPPYAGNMQYGELNFVWEAWLGFDTGWHDNEIIVNRTRVKTEADWARTMREAMSECYRVLKPGRWISLCYHDTSEGTWHLVQDMMTEVGFIPEQLETTLYIDTPAKTVNQYFAEKVTRRDLVINFRKPRPGELIAQLTLFGDEDPATFAEKARAILCEALENHPGNPADRLYDQLVSRMVRKGEFERHDFDQLLRSVAEEVGGRWYLLETADQVDEAESANEATAASRLEAFMAQYLAERPEESGIHYSDLFEQYLPVQDKPRRLLADWLPEYFFKTPEGTWRPPANDEERAQKEALRSTGTLRRIKRFARALLEGVPPHERDHPANVATAADWIRQCRRAGLYEFGRALYEKGGFSFEELSDEGQLEVEEDYQICVRRS